jgi:hypothetical protein
LRSRRAFRQGHHPIAEGGRRLGERHKLPPQNLSACTQYLTAITVKATPSPRLDMTLEDIYLEFRLAPEGFPGAEVGDIYGDFGVSGPYGQGFWDADPSGWSIRNFLDGTGGTPPNGCGDSSCLGTPFFLPPTDPRPDIPSPV